MVDKTLNNKIDQLTNAISKLVNSPVAPVLPVAPIAPIAPVLPVVNSNADDHNMLVRLDVKVDNIQYDVTTLKNQNSNYITKNEHLEVVRIQADHESRIRVNEDFRNTLMGKMIGLGSLSGLVVGFILLVVSHFWR